MSTRVQAPSLRTYRDARGGTAEEEAAAAGVSWRTWVRWEHGGSMPAATLEAVALRWGVPVDALSRAAAPGPDAQLRALLEEHGRDALVVAVRRVVRGF